jgi:hydrogenase nickel incorporation protein HypA/HybF
MHELGATEELLATAIDSAHEHGAQRVTAIDVVVGDLSGMVEDSVRLYADALMPGTIAEGATLRFRHTSATATCLACFYRCEMSTDPVSVCPCCGSTNLEIAGGREFFVERIEVDDPVAPPEGV